MNRIDKLKELMNKENVDACVITDPNSIYYFTNLRLSVGERFLGLIVSKDSVFLMLNIMFPVDTNIEVIRFDDCVNPMSILASKIEGTIAIDKNMASHFLIDLMNYKKLNIINGSIIDKVKALKDEEEVKKMIEASRLNDLVMNEVSKLIEVGKSEAQLRDEIEEKFKEIAHSDPSFETIIAYGNHGSDCHAVPSERVLKEGENIIVDMGCKYEGYCSDMTRTFFVNSNPIKEIYDTVRKANETAESIIKPGIKFKDIDKAARDEIEEKGYGKYFIHRLGHGIGMDVHEPFDVSGIDEVVVEEGMCFSIEPGIYIPGKCGVRIEDLVCVTKDGCIVLNKYPKDQEVLKR